MLNDPTNPPAPGQTPPGGEPPGQTPNPQGQTPSGQQTPITTLPPDIQDYIKRLRDEAEAANKQQKAEAKAKQAAEEARLKEQGEFKALAEKHEARVKELEPIATSYEALRALVNTQIEAQIKEWPAEVKAFDPGTDAPVESRLEWMNKSGALVAKLTGTTPQNVPPGNRPGPRPTIPGEQDIIQANMRELKKQRTYGI